ncbi:hypothetical protein AARAC_011830 [Aspergillus arachidicola]|uniref:DUF7587 domain-containing protein n=1 Tax=Aspergillus arachidicola TaxID=656916 RepID=A0A2G7FF38_9EURO|nr:hypothetical protein AARAC_011830 [Aspergillus arachidicola]
MLARPLSADAKPSILFRAECSANISFDEGYLCSRRTVYQGAPSRQDFDDHLSWKRTPTRFLSFFSSWRRALNWREDLENQGELDVVVIAVWAKDLAGVYSAEEVACRLGYFDMGLDPRRRLRNHHKEYLVEGGIAADEYRILAKFEGGGPERNVIFASPTYQISTTIPSEYFPGRRSNNALGDLEDEIYRHLGIRDDMKRDELVKAITGSTRAFPIF